MASSSTHHIKNICVFGGSSPGKEKEFLESANHLGQVLAERKIHLVYGGGSLGVMGGGVNSCIFKFSSINSSLPSLHFYSTYTFIKYRSV